MHSNPFVKWFIFDLSAHGLCSLIKIQVNFWPKWPELIRNWTYDLDNHIIHTYYIHSHCIVVFVPLAIKGIWMVFIKQHGPNYSIIFVFIVVRPLSRTAWTVVFARRFLWLNSQQHIQSSFSLYTYLYLLCTMMKNKTLHSTNIIFRQFMLRLSPSIFGEHTSSERNYGANWYTESNWRRMLKERPIIVLYAFVS